VKRERKRRSLRTPREKGDIYAQRLLLILGESGRTMRRGLSSSPLRIPGGLCAEDSLFLLRIPGRNMRRGLYFSLRISREDYAQSGLPL